MSYRNCIHITSSVLAFFFLVATAAMLTASMLSKEWMTSPGDITTGLWRSCMNSVCVNYDEVLQFKTNKIFDSILLLNVLAVGFSVISLIASLVELCRFKSTLCILVLSSNTALLAALCSILLVTYAETLLKSSNTTADYGWGFIVAYAGMATAVLASVFNLILFCSKPKKENMDFDDSLVMKVQQGRSLQLPEKDYGGDGLDNPSYARQPASQIYVHQPANRRL